MGQSCGSPEDNLFSCVRRVESYAGQERRREKYEYAFSRAVVWTRNSWKKHMRVGDFGKDLKTTRNRLNPGSLQLPG